MTPEAGQGQGRQLRIALLTVGSVGDLLPFMGLAMALQARGHDVGLVVPSVHTARVQQAGLRFVAVGDDATYQQLLHDPALWNPRQAFATVWRGLATAMPNVPQALRALHPDGADIVLTHPLASPALDLAPAQRGRAVWVGVPLAPANLRTLHDPLTMGPLSIPRWLPMAWRRALWRHVDRRFVDSQVLPGLNAMRAAHGQPPVSHFIHHMHAVPQAHLALFPPQFAAVPPDWPQPLVQAGFVRYDPDAQAALAPALQAFFDAGPPPVVVTLGTGQRQAQSLYDRVARILLQAGQRVLVLSSEAPPLPDGAHWQPYAPLARVLPQARGLVHHGGIGTAAEGLAAGLPQFVLPFAFDQFDNASRLVRLGVAHKRPAEWAGERMLRRALPAWLGDAGLAARARTVAAEPGPALDQALAWLESLAPA
jgi:rhamnosyltransferase subunit B